MTTILKEIILICSEINSYMDFHLLIADLLHFDECIDGHGCNGNALADVFPGSIETPILLTWKDAAHSRLKIEQSTSNGVFDEIVGIFESYKIQNIAAGINNFDYRIIE